MGGAGWGDGRAREGLQPNSRARERVRISTFSPPGLLPRVSSSCRFLLSPVSDLFLPLIFLGTGAGLIPASGSFAASAFPAPRQTPWVPPIKQPPALEAEALASGCPRKMGQEKGDSKNVLNNSDMQIGLLKARLPRDASKLREIDLRIFGDGRKVIRSRRPNARGSHSPR